jgi:hypothetical protein
MGQSETPIVATATEELASIADARRGVARPSTVGDITPATGAPQRPDATADGGRRPHRAKSRRQPASANIENLQQPT